MNSAPDRRPAASKPNPHKKRLEAPAQLAPQPTFEIVASSDTAIDTAIDADNPSPLTDRQMTCIDILVGGITKSQAARLVGVTPQTITRWYKDPDFRAALDARRAELHEANADRLRALASKALDVYEKVLNQPFDMRARIMVAQQILRASGLDLLPPITAPQPPDD